MFFMHKVLESLGERVRSTMLATYCNYLKKKKKKKVSHSQKHVFCEINKYICQHEINKFNNKFS